jgi:D-glycero-D-manno-heptose 1,7-bisphosphate phosphatase
VQAIFLDRDGVLNENRADHVKSRQEFVWLPGALDALAALARQERPIIVITNQSMVGRGIARESVLDAIHARMRQEALAHGGRIDAVYACLHTPSDACRCRKPRPGLLHQAATDHRIDLAQSILIGDAFTDYQAAMTAGMAYIHVRSGRDATDTPRVLGADRTIPVVANLLAAVPLCTATDRGRSRGPA